MSDCALQPAALSASIARTTASNVADARNPIENGCLGDRGSSRPAGDDEIYLAINRVLALHSAMTDLDSRLEAAHDEIASLPPPAALIVTQNDRLWLLVAKKPGIVMTASDLADVRVMLGIIRRRCGRDPDPLERSILARATEIDRAGAEWEAECKSVRARWGVEGIDENDTADLEALWEAQKTLFAMRPQTISGLVAWVGTLARVEALEGLIPAEDLARAVLEAPALARRMSH